MQNICCRFGRAASVVVFLMAFANAAWAGGRWHIGDVIICFGGGTCQVVRTSINPGTVQLLDQLSDSTSVTSPGATRGVAINNTLHLLVTDDGGPANNTTHSTGANIVEYQIAGENPSGNPVPHGVVTVFDGAGGSGSAGITALAEDNRGDMFSLTSNGSSPNITEINPAGAPVGSPISLKTQCGISQVASMDLSTSATSAYVTSLGTIHSVAFSASPACSLFANLGSGVTFYGIRDVPLNAIPICGIHQPCSVNETVLVVATGLFDSNGNGKIDTNDVNVCTDQVDHTPVSCAILLNTNGPGLTFAPWKANNKYSVGTKILDLHLHVQLVTAVTSNGKSGSTTPSWNEGGATIDNNVTWQDQGTSVLARYPVTGQTSLQALSLDPLLSTPTSSRQVSNFWMADSTSGSFFHLDFAAGGFASFTASCTGCNGNGIQSIGVYGAEDAAQPGLVSLGSQQLITPASGGTTTTTTFNFNPDGERNQTQVTGFNFIPGALPLNIAAYASAINAASGTSDALFTPIPPNSGVISAPAAPCTTTTTTGQCVIWEFDNDPVQQSAACSSNPSACAFLGVQLELFDSSNNPLPLNFNTIVAVDEQYDVTDTVDSGTHYTNSQISLHQETTAVESAVCTYQPPLSPDLTQPPTCLNPTRNTIPFKFQCTQVSNEAGLLPFLHIVQSLGPNGPIEPLLVLNGTGGTTNYRFDTTAQQWIFNLNNPGSGSFIACTEDASHTVPQFCTNYTVQSSCP